MGVDQAPGVRPGRNFERGRTRPRGSGPSPPRRDRSGGEPGSGTAPLADGPQTFQVRRGHALDQAARCPGPGGPLSWTRRPAALDQAARSHGQVGGRGLGRGAGPRPRGGRTPGCGGGAQGCRGGAHGRGTFKLAARAPSTRPPLTQPRETTHRRTRAAARSPPCRATSRDCFSCSGRCCCCHRPPPPPAPWPARAYAGWGPTAQGAAPDAVRLRAPPPACPTPGPGSPAGSAAQVHGLGGNGRGIPDRERQERVPGKDTRLERGRSWTRARRAGWVGRRIWSQIRKILGHPPSTPFTPAQARRGAGERSPPLQDKSYAETEVQRREGRCPRSLIARARLPFS